MLLKINPRTQALEAVASDWTPKELALERYLITHEEGTVPILSDTVFREPLLLVRNQVQTGAGKRADILALDRHGNGVVIELKRNAGRLGVETQALQYIADFSQYRGRHFLRKFPEVTEANLRSILGSEIDLDKINQRSRVILVAQSFDDGIYALGEWLSTKGVGFRCIAYHPVQIGKDQFLSFSVAFDRSVDALYPLSFGTTLREPGIFWHNIAHADPAWWNHLVTHQQIPACFQNAPGDQGEKILTRYIAGDRIVAYAKGYGAVGWGEVVDPRTYRLLSPGDEDDVLGGECRHRLKVRWKAVTTDLAQALPAETIRKDFDIYHPLSTSVSIDPDSGRRLLDALSQRFGKAKATTA